MLKDPCIIKNLQNAGALDTLEIDRQFIHFVKKLGAGPLTEVWQGLWNGITKVAVKTVKSSTMGAHEVLEEAQFISKLRHPKLIKLYAVCTKEEPICFHHRIYETW